MFGFLFLDRSIILLLLFLRRWIFRLVFFWWRLLRFLFFWLLLLVLLRLLVFDWCHWIFFLLLLLGVLFFLFFLGLLFWLFFGLFFFWGCLLLLWIGHVGELSFEIGKRCLTLFFLTLELLFDFICDGSRFCILRVSEQHWLDLRLLLLLFPWFTLRFWRGWVESAWDIVGILREIIDRKLLVFTSSLGNDNG